jgi:hypothetical protein
MLLSASCWNSSDRAKQNAKRNMLPSHAPGQVSKRVPAAGVWSLNTIWYFAIVRADAKHSC